MVLRDLSSSKAVERCLVRLAFVVMSAAKAWQLVAIAVARFSMASAVLSVHLMADVIAAFVWKPA
jgi:hypothetical protein